MKPLKIYDTLSVYLKGVTNLNYLPSKGNAGDQVQTAAWQKFRITHNIGINPVANTLVVAGGGWLTPHYPHLHAPIARLTRTDKRVIVLPSTVIGVRAWGILRNFSDLTLFAREKTTLREANRHGVTAILVEDLAFGLDYDDWSRQQDKDSQPVVYSFRTDRESSYPTKPDGNRDLSFAHITAEGFIREINTYRVVHTDRTHVAIVAASLGKEVHFYANSTHKNESIYQASLKHYPNVTYHGNEAIAQ